MRRAVVYAITAGILWGVTYPLTELAITLGNYLLVTFLVYLMLTMIGIVEMRSRKILIDEKVLARGSILATLNIISMALFYIGVKYTNAAFIAFIAQLYPILTMIVDGYNGKAALITVPLYTIGVFLLFKATRYNIIGLVAGIALAVVYTIYVVLYNRFCEDHDFEALNIATYMITAAMSGALSMFTIGRVRNIIELLAICTLLAVIVHVCYMLEGMSHEDLDSTIVAFALSIEPVSAIVVESMLHRIVITPTEIVGMILVTSSVIIICIGGRPINERRQTTHVETSLKSSIERIRKAYLKMQSMFYKLEDEITGIFMSLLSRENYVLIGPPGTGKTTLIYTLSKLLNAKWFYRQLTKFTDLEEILGPIDIAELLKGRVVRIYANSIVESDLALLDEIFNASSAILNTLLSILNERVIYDGDKVIPVKTWTVYASSNRVPEDEELQALYDRFPLRSFLSYAMPEETENLIIKGWLLRRELESLSSVASMSDVKMCHDSLLGFVYSNLEALARHVSPIIASFIEHVPVSNRTRVKVALYVASLIALELGDLVLDPYTIRIATLRVLKYLINNREQLSEYHTFVKAHMPDELSRLYELISEIKALINNLLFDKARERLEEAYEILNDVKNRWGPTVSAFFRTEIQEIENIMTRLRESLET
ncbi:MAG: AAA domain-containing protein [Crenarchaeota archaeon]|nr:AAA domain-containing protein [Thermoproteota archaeon]